ncbi:ATP-binding protein [Perlucidibaca aquatica]|uniref:ATP-binding protein n=1 Tax=Perlucidibaca aquatica TaxID=1852776 RepID=UPI00083B2917|nr:ATP-binding protein [Perlucidibaca aquatica]
MIFSPGTLFGLSVAYLGLLFLLAHASEKGWLPLRWVRHPAVYTLSLGVFISSWGLYGVVQFAADFGYNFLAFYMGIAGAFLVAPMFLQPLLRLAKTHQLHSLPDLLAFRFRSQGVGSTATLAILVGVMPLLTAQMQTMADLVFIVTGGHSTRSMGAFFCAVLICFTLLFGTRQRNSRGLSHDGLVVAIAAESLIKLIAMLAVSAYAYFSILGGEQGLNQWLQSNPEALQQMYQPLQGGYWHSLLLLFFFAAVVVPCMYQMAFTENREPRDLVTASWGVPLYFLLMALGIPVLLWAGEALQLKLPATYYSLGITLQSGSPWMTLTLFLGTLAASSGILIVTTLALANMLLNHVLLPISGLSTGDNLYERTLNQQRLLIICIPSAAFLLSWLPALRPDSTEMSMLSFVATIQLAPSMLALLFWPRATSTGVLIGLAAGILIWFFTLALPAFFMPALDASAWLGLEVSNQLGHWQAMGLIATLANIGCMLGFSLLSAQSSDDKEIAEACSVDNLRSPLRWGLNADSTEAFIAALSPSLGPVTAEREVKMALQDLGLKLDERRPYALRRLREQLSANLSGLLGPSMAQELLDEHLPHKIVANSPGDDIHYIELRLEEYRDKLSGLAGELDLLRRFHRQTLHDLPLGVCTLAGDLEIMSWNHAMMQITHCADTQMIGARLEDLPSPWSTLFADFLLNPSSQQLRTRIEIEGQVRWLNLHRAVIGDAAGSQVLVMEDVSALHQLESRLQHAERLAAIGRLAAGVAHEIGNPITGIASLAQNLRAEYPAEHEVHETAQSILEQTQRVSRIVQSLVGFSRTEHHARGEFEAVPLAAVMAEAVHLLKLSPEARFAEFDNQIRDTVFVRGDAQRLCQVFINILSNARDASTQKGLVILRAARHGNHVRIEIEDFGHGLPDGDIRANLFEPFVTTKPPGKGTGLGLALVHGIIEAHQGRIQLIDKRDYDQGQGVIVQILLPWASTPAALVEDTSS